MGEALRPLGSPLYRLNPPRAPIMRAASAIRRKPRRRRKARRALRAYASHLLRVETPFAEQPVHRASLPKLRRLRAAWHSSWSPNDLADLNRRLVLTQTPSPISRSICVVHALAARARLGSSWCIRTILKGRPRLTRARRPKGPSRLALRLWLRRLLLSIAYMAHYHAWHHLFSLLPLTLAVHAARKLGLSTPSGQPSSILSPCPPHLIFWRDLNMLTRSAKPQQTDPAVLTGVSGLYTKYLMDFFEQITRGRVHVHFLPYEASIAELRPSKYAVGTCIYPALRIFHRLFFFKDFSNLCSVSFRQKNAPLFVTWVSRFMERVDARIHKKFLRFLGVFLRRAYESATRRVLYSGVKVSVKGKISVSGNAKKRAQHLAYGRRSLTCKRRAVSFSQGLIRTPTGVLGMKCYLFS